MSGETWHLSGFTTCIISKYEMKQELLIGRELAAGEEVARGKDE